MNDQGIAQSPTQTRPQPHLQKTADGGFAITALVLGILSLISGLLFITGIPAVVFGILGLKHQQNRSMCITGIVTGAISIVLSVLFVGFFIFIIFAAAASYN